MGSLDTGRKGDELLSDRKSTPGKEGGFVPSELEVLDMLLGGGLGRYFKADGCVDFVSLVAASEVRKSLVETRRGLMKGRLEQGLGRKLHAGNPDGIWYCSKKGGNDSSEPAIGGWKESG